MAKNFTLFFVGYDATGRLRLVCFEHTFDGDSCVSREKYLSVALGACCWATATFLLQFLLILIKLILNGWFNAYWGCL